MSVTVPLDTPVETSKPSITIDELNRIWFDDTTDSSAPWQVIVLDDNVNSIDYVIQVFILYFNLDIKTATRRTYEVHLKGRSILAVGSWEKMVEHKNAMHGYGLRSQIEQA